MLSVRSEIESGNVGGTATDPRLLHEIFEEQVDRRPHAPAVISGTEVISYAALEARANRMARHLRGLGSGRESAVAMLLPRSADAYVAILGILKAGAAYVPIDPDCPADRVRCILENSGARFVVTTSSLARLTEPFSGTIVLTDRDQAAIAARRAARLRHVDVGPKELCYIIYAFGSTGRPKGVMIEHRNACHLVKAERSIYGVRPGDRVYQGAPLSFDLSVEEIWIALSAGAALVPAPAKMVHAGPELSRILAASGVTVLSCVPALLSTLEGDVPGLRLIILGGEACPPQVVQRWARPDRRLLNTYGPTETTVIATWDELSPGRPITVGSPVPGYRVYLLDESLRPVRPGAVGEICICGRGVGRGYVGRAEETRERFLPNPWAPSGDEDPRMYRTGDLGRLNNEGRLELRGRLDGQVKLPTGRLDRSSLPKPRRRSGPSGHRIHVAFTDTERRILRVWNALFPPHAVGRHDDFFLDLGGHSLLAARAVSQLRKDPRFAGVSVIDIYAHPSVASLAAALDCRPAAGRGSRV